MAKLWNVVWWGGDPDLQDGVSRLSKRDVYNITRSWTVMHAQADKYGMEIFKRLFRLNPVTKTYFTLIRNLSEEEFTKSFQFKAHVINVMASIDTAIANLHQPQVVIALMYKLGDTHHRRNVQRIHFDEMKVVLVDILKNDLKLDDGVITSWARFVTFIYTYIFDKLGS